MIESPSPRSPTRADRLAFFMLRSVNKAVRDHAMIADGDRVLVAVSGGKDSLTLLDLLHRRQRTAPERYDLIAGRVRSDLSCGPCVPEEWLQAWCAARGIPFVSSAIHVADAVSAVTGPNGAGVCHLCARRRRKAILELAQEHSCGKVALGHHADDRAVTALMNLLYNARLETMAPALPLFGGLFTLIRPLAYVEERDIVTYARASGYPIAGDPCPLGERSRRSATRLLLREIESEHPTAKRCILSAVERCAASTGAVHGGQDSSRTRSHLEEDNCAGY